MIRTAEQRADALHEIDSLQASLGELLASKADSVRIDNLVRKVERRVAEVGQYDRLSKRPAPRAVPGWDFGSGTEQLPQALFGLRTISFPGKSQGEFADLMKSHQTLISRQEDPSKRDFKVSTLREWAAKCNRLMRVIFLPKPRYDDTGSFATLSVEAAAIRHFYGVGSEAEVLDQLLDRLRTVTEADCVTAYVRPPEADVIYLASARGVRHQEALWGPLDIRHVAQRLIGRHGAKFVDPKSDVEFRGSSFVEREGIQSTIYFAIGVRLSDDCRERLLIFLNYRSKVAEPSKSYLRELSSLGEVFSFAFGGAREHCISELAIKRAKNTNTSNYRRQVTRHSHLPAAQRRLESLAEALSHEGVERLVLTLHVVQHGTRERVLVVQASFPLFSNQGVEMLESAQRGLVPRLFRSSQATDVQNVSFELIEDLPNDPLCKFYEPLPDNIRLSTVSLCMAALRVPNTTDVWAVLNAESPDKGAFSKRDAPRLKALFLEYGRLLWCDREADLGYCPDPEPLRSV